MPRLNLSTEQRNYAIYALKQMQRRDARLIKFNLDMAKAEDSVRDLTFGRMAFSIPEDHRALLAMIYPEIDSQDGEIRTKAWRKLMHDDLTIPYRLNKKERGNKNGRKARPIHQHTRQRGRSH